MFKELSCMKDLFQLNPEDIYLNCALMSPSLKSSVEAGILGINKKVNPQNLQVDDFFGLANDIRKEYSKILKLGDSERIAILPSVSYGMSIVSNNLKPTNSRSNIIANDKVFPSNFYPWVKASRKYGCELKIIDPVDTNTPNRALEWNTAILESIDKNTIAVCISHVHWTCGTIFNLKKIRERTNEVGALLIIDGSQSVGALPFNIAEIKPDALILTSYKWLFGPMSMALGYFGEKFDDGDPIEENWINRLNSDDFSKILNYQDSYMPKAQRYNVGEFSNFILLPMLMDGLKQVNKWTVESIQDYCGRIFNKHIDRLLDLGFWIEDAKHRSKHLIGLRIPKHLNLDTLKNELIKRSITIALRGDFIRISPNVYNTSEEIELLIDAFEIAMKNNKRIEKSISYGLH